MQEQILVELSKHLACFKADRDQAQGGKRTTMAKYHISKKAFIGGL